VSALIYVLTLVWWLAIIAFVALVVTMSVKVLRNRRKGRGSSDPGGGRDDRVRIG
jgi:hypothetical protein